MYLPRLLAAAFCTLTATLATAQDDPTQRSKDQSALDRALAGLDDAPPPTPDRSLVAATPPRGDESAFKLYDLSLDFLFSAGSSTVRDDRLEELFGGGHDPRKRGFTIQNVELAIAGAVDPYFRANLTLVSFIEPLTGDTTVELEEACLTTTSLPAGLEVQAGQFLTHVGRINPQHPHQWDFLDAPIAQTRIFGPDGMRGPGVRVGWLTPLPWYSNLDLSAQNANGETMASFLASDEYFAERPIGGRPFADRQVHGFGDLALAAHLVNSFEIGDATTLQLGLSGLLGPNATGRGADSRIFGSDLVLRWSDDQGGRQAHELVWQSEFLARSYDAAAFVDVGDPLDPGDDIAVPGATLRDYGLYSQLLWRLDGEWRVGERFDWVSGSGASWDADTRALVSRETDPFRCDRRRLTTMLEWSPSHFSRVRLQYSYDHAPTIEGEDAHSIWLGGEVGIGAHAAHSF